MTRIILRLLNAPLLVLFVAIGIALQSSLFTFWPFIYLQPDFVLLVVVWCAFRRNFEEGGWITLMISNMSEIHSISPQGLHLISYMSVFLLLRIASKFLVISNIFSYSMSTVIGSLLFKVVGMIVLHLLGVNGVQWKHALAFLVFGSLVEGLFSIWVFRGLEKFDSVTFKSARLVHTSDEEIQLGSEGF